MAVLILVHIQQQRNIYGEKMKRLSLIILIMSSIGLGIGCSSGGGSSSSGSGETTTGGEGKGAVTGKVTIPVVDNNKIAYQGLNGATVEISNTDYNVQTPTDGSYSIDGIPSGNYNIKASPPFVNLLDYGSETKSTTVINESITIVSDFRLTPSCTSLKQILYGKVYNNDKSTPLSNKAINLHVASFPPPLSPGTIKSTTTTSSDASYAFQIGSNTYMLTSSGTTLKFIDTDLDFISVGSGLCGLIYRDIYVP